MTTTAVPTAHQLVRDAVRVFEQSDIPAARREAETLLAAVLGCRPLEVYLVTAPTPEHVAQFERWVGERAAGMPTQYLTGRVTFCGDVFLVTPATLIPRPETELVVAAALRCARRLLNRSPGLRIVDVGTGCGNLAISLTKLLPSARITAIDRSYAALDVARVNAARLGVAERIAFVQGNGMHGLARDFTPHMVVANPPYIPSDELPHLPADVQHEPRLALDGGHDGCAVIREWLTHAAERLAVGGCAIFEIGAGQGELLSAHVRTTNTLRVVDMQPDWNDIPRVLIAERI